MITDSRIAWGDQMGAQLTKIAELVYVCKENGQDLAFWNELKDFRRGFRFLDAFDIDGIVYLERCGSLVQRIVRYYCKKTSVLPWKIQMERIYHKKAYRYLDWLVYELVRMRYQDFHRHNTEPDGVHTASALLAIGPEGNHDIHSGFGTYRDWGKYAGCIRDSIHFKKAIRETGDRIFSALSSSKKKVSVHLRRTDYLILSSLCLDDTYYEKAMSFFEPDMYQFLIFSDDIEACKEMDLFRGRDVVFMEPNPGPVDMYLMTLCDGNIIANSTFSFWGAFLGSNADRRVVCPRDFIGPSGVDVQYINGNYYPEDWLAI